MSHRFVAAYLCNECDKPLNYDEVMDSYGVCPYCGAVSKGTIVAAKKISIKQETPPIQGPPPPHRL